MNKHRIYNLFLLSIMLTACRQEETIFPQGGEENYLVTASIVTEKNISSRMTEGDDAVSFVTGDRIHIGWNGLSAAYQYDYTGTDKIFTASTDDDKKLWNELPKSANAAVDVYAWYGAGLSGTNAIPAANATVSVPADQTELENYTNSLYLAAHQTVSRVANKLDFAFYHLMARMQIVVKKNDTQITQENIMNANIAIEGVACQGTLGTKTDNSGDWALTAHTTDGIGILKMRRGDYSVGREEQSFKCYLIPQKLTSSNKIVITLADGKIYTCALSGDLTLNAGNQVTLTINLKTGDGYEIDPTVSIFEGAYKSAYSGNRIFSAISTGTETNAEYHFTVYDKQSNGSWKSSNVYEDENGNTKFPQGQSENYFKINKVVGIDMYGDYAVIGYGGAKTEHAKRTFFIKKSRTTGNWYVAAGPLMTTGYGVAINQHFLVSGNANYEGTGKDTYAYRIDENGDITDTDGVALQIQGFKLNIAENDVLASSDGVYRLSIGSDGKPTRTKITGNLPATPRPATDGYRVIVQQNTNGQTGPVTIYKITDNKLVEESFKGNTKPTGGAGVPVAIYDRYALVGNSGDSDKGIYTKSVKLFYYNDDNVWELVGENVDNSFLNLAKQYNSELERLSNFDGGFVALRGTNALISSGGSTYYIENIDKIVSNWYASQAATTSE